MATRKKSDAELEDQQGDGGSPEGSGEGEEEQEEVQTAPVEPTGIVIPPPIFTRVLKEAKFHNQHGVHVFEEGRLLSSQDYDLGKVLRQGVKLELVDENYQRVTDYTLDIHEGK